MEFLLNNEGNANYARLTTLLMEEGTNRIKINLLSHLIDHMTLPQALACHKKKINDLKAKNKINSVQYEIIYPENSPEPNYGAIDMTLLLFLARNLSRGKNSINWNSAPKEIDIKWQHDAVRLKEIRNTLFHLVQPELNQSQFRNLWDSAVSALTRLGTPGDVIESYISRDIDPTRTRICMLQLREQVLEERYGVYTIEAKRRRQMYCFALLFSLLALLTAAIIVVPLVLFLRPVTPCDKYLIKIQTGT